MRYWSSLVPVLGLGGISSVRCLQQTLSTRHAPGLDQNATYDYIVVGGGTAGLTIASKLAETMSVAVIEAGGFYEIDNGNLSVVPGYAQAMPFLAPVEQSPEQPSMDWGFVSEPQTGANDRRIHYAQGKTLGGSSAINSLVYHRATLGAYQRWAELVDDESYTFDNLLPFFVESSALTPPEYDKWNLNNATVEENPGVFGSSEQPSSIQVSWGNWVDPTVTWLEKALDSIGIKKSSLNDGHLDGVADYSASTIDPRTATRSTSKTAYLTPALFTAGLAVYHHSMAEKILFDAKKTATGVLVSTNGSTYRISARKEVIVAAGTFQSPHLLMVSGIGPAETLSEFSIPVVSELAGVGQNLWDEIFAPVSYNVRTPSRATIEADPNHVNEEVASYYTNQTGPLSSFGAYIGFEKLPESYRANFSEQTKTALAQFPSDWPEIEYLGGSGADGEGNPTAIINAVLLAPVSRGNVTIASASMQDNPTINMGWLTAEADQQVAIAAIRRIREAFAGIPQETTGTEVAPGKGAQSDSDILEHFKNTAIQIWHASGTCKMGTLEDDMAVVDSKAKVIGVQKLRIVDASILPFALPGHPQSTIYALAEKIAADIVGGK